MSKKKNIREQRKILSQQIGTSPLSLAAQIKSMRKIVGKTQIEYAQWIGIAPRIIMDIERGVANPTQSTLQKIGAPFGLDVGFIKIKDE